MAKQRTFWERYTRQRISRRRALQLAAMSGGGIALMAACGGGGGEGDGTPPPTAPAAEGAFLGGIIRSALIDPQSKFDAQQFPTFTVQAINSFSYSRLLKSISGPDDPSTEELDLPQEDWYRPVADLAQQPEVTDETTFVFTLQDGAVWHDVPPLNGRPVTPDDVVKAFDYYRSARPDNGLNLQAIDTVTAVGTNQIQIKLKELFGPFLIMISSPSDLWIYPPELTDNPDQLNSTMIGTGPFILREYQQGVGAKWDKNPDWWELDEQGNRLPYTDGLDFPVIPDKNNEISQYAAGRLDLMLSVPAEVIDAFRNQNPNAIISKNIANLLNFLFFPPAAYEANEPPFNDPRVRQAVSLALDREALIDLASGGQGGAKHNLINAGSIWYLDPDSDEMGEAAQFFTRDVAKAKQLLAAADHDTLDTELHFSNNAYVFLVPYYNTIAEAIPPMLREAGINAKLVTHDYQSEWINPDAGIFYGNLKSGIAYALETPVPHPWNQFTNQFAPGNVRNHSHINDSEILDLVDQLGRESDFDRGRDLAVQIQKMNAEKMYYVPSVGPFGFGARQAYTRAYSAPTSFGIGSESTPRFQINTAEQQL